MVGYRGNENLSGKACAGVMLVCHMINHLNHHNNRMTKRKVAHLLQRVATYFECNVLELSVTFLEKRFISTRRKIAFTINTAMKCNVNMSDHINSKENN